MICVLLAGRVIVWRGKTFNVAIFSDTINVINVAICMMILLITEDHAGNTPWPPNIHLHRWKAHMQIMILRWHRCIMGDSRGELQDLTNRLVHRAKSTQKRERSLPTAWTTSLQILARTARSYRRFKYLGAAMSKDGTCSVKTHIRIALAMAEIATLNRVWRCNTVNVVSKFNLTSLLSPTLSSVLVWTLLDDCPGFWNQMPNASLTWSTRPTIGYGARSTSLWVHRNFLWQLSRDGNLLGSSMSTATTFSPSYPSGHFGGWARPWSTEEMLDGWHQRVDISVSALCPSF